MTDASTDEPSASAVSQQLSQRWQALADRERLLLTVGGLVLGLALLWWVALAPAWRTVRAAPQQLESLDVQLQNMQRLSTEAKALRAMPPLPAAAAQAALTAAAQRLGDKAKLSLQGERAVLQITHLPGDQLAAWLAEVRISARARAVEAQLTRTPQGDYAGSVVLATGARS
jgi:general secretion pathway protein M